MYEARVKDNELQDDEEERGRSHCGWNDRTYAVFEQINSYVHLYMHVVSIPSSNNPQ